MLGTWRVTVHNPTFTFATRAAAGAQAPRPATRRRDPLASVPGEYTAM